MHLEIRIKLDEQDVHQSEWLVQDMELEHCPVHFMLRRLLPNSSWLVQSVMVTT